MKIVTLVKPIVFLLFSVVAAANSKHQLAIFDFNNTYSSSNEKQTCLTIEDLVKQSLSFSTESRLQVQQFYQARAAFRIQLGQVFPQIDFGEILSSGLDTSATMNTALPLIGFIFPNRWFDLKASHILKNAEKEELHSVLANRAQMILSLYYDIQMQKWSIRILEFYIHEMSELIKFLRRSRRIGPNKVTDEDFAILENIKGKLIFKRSFVDALSSTLPQLATAIGFDPSMDWSQLSIEEQDFSSIKHEHCRDYDEFWPLALERSTEVKKARYLIDAAIATKRSTYFDFLDPAADINFGFGSGPRTKSARSNITAAQIRLKQTEMLLSVTIQNALNNHNDAVESFAGIAASLERLKHIRLAVQKHINDTSVPLDINRVMRHFKFAKAQALNYVTSYFSFRAAQADLNRYTWRGKIYDGVRNYIVHDLPAVLKEARRAQSFRYAVRRKFNK